MITGNDRHRNEVGSIAGTLLSRAAFLRAVRSLFWVMMLVVHTPAFIASWRSVLDGGGPLSALALYGLALSFFALKIINVSFLRWHVSRRSCVAWCVVVALLHVDVVQPDRPTFVPECITVAVASCLFACAATLRRKFARVFNHGSRVQRHFPHALASANTLWQDAFRPHCWLLVLGIRRLRAPPFMAR